MTRRLRERPEAPCLLLLVLVLTAHGLVLWSERSSGGDRAPWSGVPLELAGDIHFPGVYLFQSPAELRDLLALHGRAEDPEGPLGADELFSRPGTRILISRSPSGTSVSREEMAAFVKLTLGIPLSVNQESEEGLTAIPGIGPATARAIVAQRSAREGFRSLDDLLSVPGIGPSLYTRIKPYLILWGQGERPEP